jgi:ABC-type polysaccharide/polyol phosphate transport system ATPase subunit
MEVVKKYCGRTAYMKHGALAYFGDTNKAVEMYLADNQ